MKSKTIAVIVAALNCPGFVSAQVPPGFELVKLTQEMQYYDAGPSINNAGLVVFTTLFGTPWSNSEIFLYDNGKLKQITDNEDRDVLPEINDDGTIVWCGGIGAGGCSLIWELKDGVKTLIAENTYGAGPPDINQSGVIAWEEKYFVPCADIKSKVRVYDGVSITDVFEDVHFANSVVINDSGELAWSRHSTCTGYPWHGWMMVYSNGEVIELAANETTTYLPQINDNHHVAYSGNDGSTWLWRAGAAPLKILPKGYQPDINNLGHIAYHWNAGSAGLKQVFLYREGKILQITNETQWVNDYVRLNDWDEMVWQIRPPIELNLASDIMLMRRIRNGEANYDGKVDGGDHAKLAACLTGPAETDGLADCRFLDIDHDRDVDLGDFALFQNNFGWQAPPDLELPPGVGEQP